MRFTLPVIAFGLAIIVFTLLFGFPKAPPFPDDPPYAQAIDYGPIKAVAGGSGYSETITVSSSSTPLCYTTNGDDPATNGSSGCTVGTVYGKKP